MWSYQPAENRDLKSSSRESFSFKAKQFISETHNFPHGTSKCGSTISKTSKGCLEKEISINSFGEGCLLCKVNCIIQGKEWPLDDLPQIKGTSTLTNEFFIK